MTLSNLDSNTVPRVLQHRY
uniref:Uncharacterized protein n=1 Tax=Arundo donax TaxID=35708 RepID=A0A0A9HEV2_ARUDO